MRNQLLALGFAGVVRVVLGLLAMSSPAIAQDVNFAIPNFYSEPGDNSQREPNDPIGTEAIDPFTGSLNLSNRDLVVPGNGGLDIAITRTYRSLAGQPGVLGPNHGPTDSKRTIFGIGWDISLGRVWQSNGTGAGNLSATSSRTQCRVASPDARYNPILELPDGTREPMVSANSSVTTYAFITPGRAIGKCIMTSDPPAEKGDGGLIVHAHDGTKVWFNKFGVVFNSSATQLSRKMAFHPTRVESPNGRNLTITYLNRGLTNDYALIDTITADDGRQVKFEYWDQSNGNIRIKSIRALGATPARQWDYDYNLAVTQGTGNYYYLTKVTRPDGKFWEYDYRTSSGLPGFHSMETVTTPTGLTTTYSYILQAFPSHNPSEQVTVVSSKVVGGTASSSTWNYQYFPAPIVSGTVDRTRITGPENKCTEYEHTSGNVSAADFWKIGTLVLIKHSTGSSCTGTTPKTETFAWTPQVIATQGMYRPPNFSSSTGFSVPLMNQRVIALDGTNYTTDITAFNSYGSPTTIAENGNDGSRTTTLGYYEDTTKWIVGPERVTSQSVSGVTGSISRSYFSSTGNLQTENRYGSSTSFTFLSNGEVDEQTDPNGHKTKFLNYKRGIAQEIRRKRDATPANDIVITQVVDDVGNITSVTNGRGKTTGFGYDGSDQVNAITTPNPGTTDSNVAIARTYNVAGIGYKSVLTRGTYQETREHNGFGDLTRVEAKDTSTGQSNSQLFTYDDARRLKYAYDPNETATDRRTTRVYDAIDRVKELWHPGDNPKIKFDYDPLGKVIRTDERNFKFSTKFRAYGDPSEQWQIETIGPYVNVQTEPESQTTTIARNTLGMVTSVTRDGITRSFAFDSRLFPDSETHPETGLTDLGTDNEGKITSKKVGAAPIANFQYDAFDRLDFVDYPGSTPDVDYDYYGDDLVKTVIRGPTRWDYLYDDNGNLTEEKLVYTGVGTFITNYLPDDKDALTRISYPTPPSGTRLVVDYLPDALGRPTRVGNYVTSLQYWPNGQLKQIHYANNVVTDIGQNQRLFPTSFSSLSAAGLYPSNFLYGYDATGNPNAITDYVNGANNKTLAYDGLNQLITATATGAWGSGSLTYDKRGNLKTKVLGSDSLTYNYNVSANRLDTITGSRPFTFQYDLYGNVTGNGTRTFTYDDSSNLTSANTSPATTMVYDGNNRRVAEAQSGITSRLSVYSRAGLRLFEQDTVSFETTDLVYLGSNLIASRAICYNLTDSDSDGIPNCYELRAGLNPQSAADAPQDQDGDGLSNLAEYQAGTDFYKSDTDADGLNDKYENQYALGTLVYNPTADADSDGLTNLQEFQAGTLPNDSDTDNDGIPDGQDPNPLFNPAVLVPILDLLLQ